MRDESDREGMRIVIEVKRDEESQIILNKLFKLTQMQESFGMIMLAIVAGQPRELGILDDAASVHRAPHRRGAPAHAIRAAQGRRARAHFARLPDRARSHRRRDPHHPRIGQPRQRAREPARLLPGQENIDQRRRQGQEPGRREAEEQEVRHDRPTHREGG